MIAIYIQELLATNNRVIVPNFGAFLVRTTSKSKDANTLEEKLKDVYFSPFLKFNDELLEKYIISKEGISKPEAAEKIKKFIDEVKSHLDKGIHFDIKSFGSFSSDKQGKVEFIPEIKEVEVKVQSDKVSDEPKKTKTKESKLKESPKKSIKEKEPVEEIEKTEIKETVLEIKTTEPTKEIIKEIPKTEIKQSVMTTKPTIKYDSKKSKSTINKGLVWSIAIGLPLAAIFIWGLLNFNIVSKIFEKDTKVKTEKTTKIKSKKDAADKITTPESATQTQQELDEKQVAEQAQPITTTKQAAQEQKKYYIIAGSFKNNAYASAYLKKLQEQGYPAEKLEERNGMHAVSFNSFTDKQKAFAEYKFITQEKKLQAWILYY